MIILSKETLFRVEQVSSQTGADFIGMQRYFIAVPTIKWPVVMRLRINSDQLIKQ